MESDGMGGPGQALDAPAFANGASDFAIDRAVDFLRSLASPHRMKILCQLVDGEKSVGAMERAINLRQATLSQHLARLRADGLVATRRDGQTIFYRIASPEALEVLTVMKALFCHPDHQDDAGLIRQIANRSDT